MSEEIGKINKNKNFMMGDFKGKVVINWQSYEQLGPYAVKNSERNGNWQRTLELCRQHNRFITNTFYEHKES